MTVTVALAVAPVLGLRADRPDQMTDARAQKAHDLGVRDARIDARVARLGAAVAEVDEPRKHIVAGWPRGGVLVHHQRAAAVAITGVQMRSATASADHARGDRLFDRRVLFFAERIGDEWHPHGLQARRVAGAVPWRRVDVPPTAGGRDHRRGHVGIGIGGGFARVQRQRSDRADAVDAWSGRTRPQRSSEREQGDVVVAADRVVARVERARLHRVADASGIGGVKRSRSGQHGHIGRGTRLPASTADDAVRGGNHVGRVDDDPAAEEAGRGRARLRVIQSHLEGEARDRDAASADDARFRLWRGVRSLERRLPTDPGRLGSPANRAGHPGDRHGTRQHPDNQRDP